ncbi:hypothetical protein PoB_001289700 [Plakobranchus ocellatus]|uniref:Uncharacterized protein n=1 Tax=Plakobranchus ocellatus TaxID=259542 RepID=A0AAV3YW33_9GAST|nr:hypothetical protein PoB_001289700 [Plakobranchus ocellatus]
MDMKNEEIVPVAVLSFLTVVLVTILFLVMFQCNPEKPKKTTKRKRNYRDKDALLSFAPWCFSHSKDDDGAQENRDQNDYVLYNFKSLDNRGEEVTKASSPPTVSVYKSVISSVSSHCKSNALKSGNAAHQLVTTSDAYTETEPFDLAMNDWRLSSSKDQELNEEGAARKHESLPSHANPFKDSNGKQTDSRVEEGAQCFALRSESFENIGNEGQCLEKQEKHQSLSLFSDMKEPIHNVQPALSTSVTSNGVVVDSFSEIHIFPSLQKARTIYPLECESSKIEARRRSPSRSKNKLRESVLFCLNNQAPQQARADCEFEKMKYLPPEGDVEISSVEETSNYKGLWLADANSEQNCMRNERKPYTKTKVQKFTPQRRHFGEGSCVELDHQEDTSNTKTLSGRALAMAFYQRQDMESGEEKGSWEIPRETFPSARRSSGQITPLSDRSDMATSTWNTY